jgi:hypothetical protein
MKAMLAATRIIARYVLRLLENYVTISMNLDIEKSRVGKSDSYTCRA